MPLALGTEDLLADLREVAKISAPSEMKPKYQWGKQFSVYILHFIQSFLFVFPIYVFNPFFFSVFAFISFFFIFQVKLEIGWKYAEIQIDTPKDGGVGLWA